MQVQQAVNHQQQQFPLQGMAGGRGLPFGHAPADQDIAGVKAAWELLGAGKTQYVGDAILAAICAVQFTDRVIGGDADGH
jgi:hypothetical protein